MNAYDSSARPGALGCRAAVASAAATIAFATVAAAGALGAAAPTASAEPAPPGAPVGMPAFVHEVLVPSDPAFWNPLASGIRVATPLEPGDEIYCSAGFEPPISCSRMTNLRSEQRILLGVDVPTGSSSVRVWFDRPQWGEGSTGELNERLIRALGN